MKRKFRKGFGDFLLWATCYFTLVSMLLLSYYGLNQYFHNKAGIIPQRNFVDDVLDRATFWVEFDNVG